MVISRSLSGAKSVLRPFFSISRFSIPPTISSTNTFTAYSPSAPSSYVSGYPFSSAPEKRPQPSSSLLLNHGNVDVTRVVCPGCGIHMQDSDPKTPGFFLKPSAKGPSYKPNGRMVPISPGPEVSSCLKSGSVIESESLQSSSPLAENLSERPVVCARCHSLRHYGKVKDPSVENLLPEFDFYHMVGKRLVSSTGARTVILLVVDATDFDGSFPRRLAKLVTEAIEENYRNWKEGKSGNVPRIVLVVTKIDLLPTSLSPTRLEHWVRQRAQDGGAGFIKKVHFVSPVKDWGLKDLVQDVKELAGARGHVWAVGMQNAGKSTLLNAMGKCCGGGRAQSKITHLTEAPVPGTTLGIIRVDGVLTGNAKLFDTPGLLNPNQITTRLTRDEQKLVNITKELKPRTYRIKQGHSVHIGGLMRVDIEQLSVDSLYVTVWASPYLPLHMGRTENASTMLKEHFGRQLQPPIGEKRVEELGKWVRHEFRVSGDSWDSSCADIAGGGLGWFGIGIKGDAVVGVWTYEGVDVVLRNSLIPYRAENFEVAGFTVSKIVSKADQALNKQKSRSVKKKQSSQQIPAVAVDPV